jgi:hypothetical protein
MKRAGSPRTPVAAAAAARRRGPDTRLELGADVFEIQCWNGDALRVAFAIDTHDRESLPGPPARAVSWHR